jgi:uncharacterized membrane protein
MPSPSATGSKHSAATQTARQNVVAAKSVAARNELQSLLMAVLPVEFYSKTADIRATHG